VKRFGLEENATPTTASSLATSKRLGPRHGSGNDHAYFSWTTTAGLDPQVRREIYDIIEELRREKKTILMTTHYIEEAERLCDRCRHRDHGK